MTSERKRLIVVLGMHRSGTSTITRALTVLGVRLGDRLMPAVPGDNDKGFYEDIDVSALNDSVLKAVGSDWHSLAPIASEDVENLRKMGYFLSAVDLLKQKAADSSVFGFKDPRVSKLLPFWKQVFEHCNFDVRYLLTVRNPLSVAESLRKRNGFSHEKSYALWLGHVITSLLLTKDQSRVLVDFDQFLGAPQRNLATIAKRFRLKVDAREMKTYLSEFLDRGLRHNIFSVDDLNADPACPPLVHDIYSTLLEYANGGKPLDIPAFYELTLRWADEFSRNSSSLHWLDHLLTQVTDLQQSVNDHEGEIRTLINSAIAQDQNVFTKLFDAEWYLKTYPDVAAAGIDPYQHYMNRGMAEGRLPVADPAALIRDTLVLRAKERNDQEVPAIVTEVQEQRIAKLEQDVPKQLAAIKQAHEQQKRESEDRFALLERTHFEQLSQSRLQMEAQLSEQICREKSHAEEITTILSTHELQRREHDERNAERANLQLKQLADARQLLEANLLKQLERENSYSLAFQEILQAQERYIREQAELFALRERAHLEQLGNVQHRIEAHLVEATNRDIDWSIRLREIQEGHELQMRKRDDEITERGHLLAEQAASRERILVAKLVEVIETQEHSAVARERGFELQIAELNRKLNYLNGKFAEYDGRIESLTEIANLGERKINGLSDRLGAIQRGISTRLSESIGELVSWQAARNPPVDETHTAAAHPTHHDRTPVVVAKTLAELAQYQGIEFVDCAYRTLLRRDPDPQGRQYYLGRILNGSPKIQILMEISGSEEARKAKASLSGLTEAIRRFRFAQKPIYRIFFRSLADIEIESIAENRMRAIEQKLYSDSRLFDSRVSQLIFNLNDALASADGNNLEVKAFESERAYANPHASAGGASAAKSHSLPVADGTWEWSQYQAVKDRIRNIKTSRRESFAPKPLDLLDLPTDSFLSVAGEIDLPAPGNSPDVSIILPVFNNLKLTLECLLSISQHADPSVTFEVLVRDDASTDDTVKIVSAIKNVRIAQNPENMGFLRNCNRALESVRGQYVLFLNNDVQVSSGWLKILLETFSQYPNVGAVGPRFLYPSGHLQEAGAAFRPDATAEMVGLNEDPEQARFSYVRRVDYTSGACLMLPTILVRELGGFAEEYLPCYCEDGDLCLRVQEKGYFVYCNPAVTIVHHLSKTTALISDEFKYRCVARNQNVLFKRWASRLDRIATPRVLAFYLPQFYPFPENNTWWGEGFTEWTNVAKARPNFQGHYQPRLPADLGYYDLRLPEVMAQQADLARRSGIDGFCFYYYWFGGKRLLDVPIERMLAEKNPDFPFCLCWANENWSRRWDGQDSEILMAQRHSPEDDFAVIADLVRYFRDARYIRIDGRPLMLIYRVQLFPDFAHTAARWRAYCREHGIGEIYIAMVESFELVHLRAHPSTYGCDASVEFPPQELAEERTPSGAITNPQFKGIVADFRDLAVKFATRELPHYTRFMGVAAGWDNTARMQDKSYCFEHATPGAFQAWLEEAMELTRSQHYGDERLIFVNAWNEWAEGAYLEPDRRYGHAFLDAVRNAKEAATLLRRNRTALDGQGKYVKPQQ